MSKNKKNALFDIYVNNKDVEKNGLNEEEYLAKKETHINIGIYVISFYNLRVEWIWKQGVWNDG